MTDAELVGQVLAGQTARFETLVDRYLPMVRGLCISRVPNPAHRDDVVQDAFLQAFQQLNRLRDPGRFGPWLARIARNACYTWLRGHSRRERLNAQIAVEASANVQTPEAEAIRRETVEWVHGAIARLPEKTRDAMALCYVEGLSIAEASRVLRVRETALKKRLQYGRQAVGEVLFAQLEAQPQSDTRSQKARVLAALPLAAAPWKASAAAVAGASGLAVSAKLLASAGLAALAIAAATWLWLQPQASSPQSDSEPSQAASTAGTSAGETSPFSASTAETDPTSPTPAAAQEGTVTASLTVRYFVPQVPDKPAEAPLAANARVRIVPTRFDQPAFERLFRDAGADPGIAKAILALRSQEPAQGKTWLYVLAEAGITEGAAKASWEKIGKYLQSLDPTERERRERDMGPQPVWDEAREIVTDAQGRVHVTNLFPGEYAVANAETGTDTEGGGLAGNAFSLRSGTDFAGEVTILDPVSRIQGAVTDANTGEPVPQAEARLSGVPAMQASPSAQSKEDGHFDFGPFMTAYGPFELHVAQRSYKPVTVRGERRPGVPSFIDVRLGEPRAAVTGRVFNADGSPAPGITIMRGDAVGDGFSGSIQTDAEGRYRLPHDGGTLKLYAGAMTARSETATLTLEPDQSAVQDFTLPPWSRVVLDIRLPDGSVPEKIDEPCMLTPDGLHSFGTLDKEGDSFVLAHLKAGEYHLLFGVEGCEGVRLPIHVRDDMREQHVLVQLQPAVSAVRVRVVDPAGRPLPNLKFSVQLGMASYDAEGTVSGGSWSSYRDARTDATGLCILRGLPPGDYQVGWSGTTYFSAPTNETVVWTRQPEEQSGQPAGIYVSLDAFRPVDERGKELPLMREGMDLFVINSSGVTDSLLEPGRNTVIITKSGYTSAIFPVDMTPERLAELRGSGMPDRSVDAVFGRGGVATGYATDENGQPLAGRQLLILPADLHETYTENRLYNYHNWERVMRRLAQGATTGDDGSFRIDHLPPGPHYIGLVRGYVDRALQPNPIHILPDTETTLTLTESP